MVTYIFTPWRDHAELLKVRRQFYPEHAHRSNRSQQQASSSNGSMQTKGQNQHHAVARVSMWTQRGNCPHLVESTAQLMAAILSDNQQVVEIEELSSAQGLVPARSAIVSSSSYAVRAAYSAAFSRFVTGLLDSHQDKQRKMSMYAVAKSVGLPATFVELRHQATHEQLPSLTRLRVAARKALDWIWDYYWRHLPDEGESREDGVVVDRGCHELIARYLAETDDSKRAKLVLEIKQRVHKGVLLALDTIGDSAVDSKSLWKIVSLTREILGSGAEAEVGSYNRGTASASRGKDLEQIRTEIQRSRQNLADLESTPSDLGTEKERRDGGPSWSLVEDWVPKPIGVV